MATLTESGTVSVESIAQSFFSDSLIDGRFISSDFHAFHPDHPPSETSPLEWTLPALRSKSIYRLSQLVLSLQVSLTTTTGTKLPAASKTALSNNALNALFKSSSILLNNTPISSSSGLHYYKAGVTTSVILFMLLTFFLL